MRDCDVVIIGAGAAGLMCAIESAKRGRSVIVLEQSKHAGRKILMSGGGRCNFTNMTVGPDNFISNNPHFCRSALARYTPKDFIKMVERHQIPYFEKTLGQLFCQRKSRDIVTMLLNECDLYGVRIYYSNPVETVSVNHNGRFIIHAAGIAYHAASCVVACGGLTVPSMGSSPFGYRLAEAFGLSVVPTRAALVPLTWHLNDKESFGSLSGSAFSAVVSNSRTQFTESVLFTHRGMSGPAILQMSSYWKSGESLFVDFFSGACGLSWLLKKKESDPKQWLATILSQRFSKRFVQLMFGEQCNYAINQFSKTELNAFANNLSQFEFKPNGTEGYRTAEVTLGGVNCNDLSSKTMMARNVPGLFFIGEVVDVTGWLGGYNFQWAWASGHAAGQVA